jgi:hypothetical protein
MSSNHWTRVFPVLWNDALYNYRRESPGRGIDELQFSKLLAEAWIKSATLRSAVAALRCTEIYQFNPDVLRETVLVPRSVSERPLYFNVNRDQETLSGNKKQAHTETHTDAAISRSMSVARPVRETMPSPNIGWKLTLLCDPSTWIRLRWLKSLSE